MTTTDPRQLPLTEPEDREAVVDELLDAGLVTIAEDGALEIVPHDEETVVALVKRLGAARRKEG